jgi:hypothetical protein
LGTLVSYKMSLKGKQTGLTVTITTIDGLLLRLTRSVPMATASRTPFAFSAVRELWKHSVHVAEIGADLSTSSGCRSRRGLSRGTTARRWVTGYREVGSNNSLPEHNIPTVWIGLGTCWHDHREFGGTLLGRWNRPVGLMLEPAPPNRPHDQYQHM